MQFLGIPPGAAVAVFAEVLHHQTHIFQMANPRFRMSEPKTLRMTVYQPHCALAQIQWSRSRRGRLMQRVLIGSHGNNLKSTGRRGKGRVSR